MHWTTNPAKTSEYVSLQVDESEMMSMKPHLLTISGQFDSDAVESQHSPLLCQLKLFSCPTALEEYT